MAIAGSYLYRWRVEDQSGNYTIVDRTVNVVDTTAPLMNLLGTNPYTVEAADGSAYTDPGTTATDNAASAMTKATSGTVDMGLPGSYTLDISYTDVSGNVSNKVLSHILTTLKHSESRGFPGFNKYKSCPF